MERVQLNRGLFKQSQEIGKRYLLEMDVDRLMAPCYEAAGLKPRKKRYGGWEEMEIAGHSLGHWLSAASEMYEATGDVELKHNVEYAVDELAYIQSYDAEGYVSGFKRDCFDEVFTGDFRVDPFGLGGSWVPWYSIEKIFSGLVSAYRLAHSNHAKKVVYKLADWAEKGLKHLTDDQFQQMLICEHGSMCEVMGSIYEITNEKRFLNLAERFYHHKIMDPLKEGQDQLEGKHANTQIPKVIGALKLYKLTQREDYLKIAEFFWDQVVYKRSYVIGGNSNREHFDPIGTENLGILTNETCNTYNMLKLTSDLFEVTQDSRYFDYYERALYNHILASQEPTSGHKTYFVSTEPGHFKVYGTKDESFWCCTGTGMENPARYTRDIYYKTDSDFYVNLFIKSTIYLEDKQMKWIQETEFPYENKTKIVAKEATGDRLSLRVRKPDWIKGTCSVTLNGKSIDPPVEKGYFVIDRYWFNDDTLTLSLPMEVMRYVKRDDTTKQAFLYGPIVLAGLLGKEQFPETDIVPDHLQFNHHPLIEVPNIVTDQSLSDWLHLVDPDTLTFQTDAVGEPGSQILTMIPFFALHHERYTLYWSVYDRDTYRKLVANKAGLNNQENDHYLDTVQLGEQQSEVNHQVESDQSTIGYHDKLNRHYRQAEGGGYFRYTLIGEANQDHELIVTYFKEEEKVSFDMFINNHLVKEMVLNDQSLDQLVKETIQIDSSLLKENGKLTVEFRTKENESTGHISELQLLKTK
ncbi:hypothetical protein SAMN05421734_11424 [Pelagirhabdus alkalitolerans]|uniref:Uncharacterized protein n=1 Tax=Pelagirhabdus alkalitolerans TaxID=1612202 RepID=A0A1G6N6I2_9BACI|nr:glycoside hydrolase family 127 protein [Pelagirhabdus alkalitolerans]SDC62846.1 hypothetical protein SAMN05421734_11424 [Pelagirhabdus alkalitolerans]